MPRACYRRWRRDAQVFRDIALVPRVEGTSRPRADLRERSQFTPFGLCKAILSGLQRQLRRDGLVQDKVYGTQPHFEEDVTTAYRDMKTGELLNVEERTHLEEIFMAGRGREDSFVDAVSGQALQVSLVRAARAA